MATTRTLYADFPTRTEADHAITALEGLGYEASDISVVAKEGEPTTDTDGHTVASDAATGGVIGGVAGLLAGVGAIPALAGLLFGGPIAAALGLVGAAATTVSGIVTGGVVGGLIGALRKVGIDEEDARRYEATINNGGVVLGVPVSPETEPEVHAILAQSQSHIARVDSAAAA